VVQQVPIEPQSSSNRAKASNSSAAGPEAGFCPVTSPVHLDIGNPVGFAVDATPFLEPVFQQERHDRAQAHFFFFCIREPGHAPLTRYSPSFPRTLINATGAHTTTTGLSDSRRLRSMRSMLRCRACPTSDHTHRGRRLHRNRLRTRRLAFVLQVQPVQRCLCGKRFVNSVWNSGTYFSDRAADRPSVRVSVSAAPSFST